MKRFCYLLLFLTMFSLMSFSIFKRIGMIVYIENLNQDENFLKIRFKPFDFKNGNPINYAGRIDILKNDTLYVRLIADTIVNKSAEITFNKVPEGFKLIYPEKAKEIPQLNKDDNLRFILSGVGTFYEWTYNPYFSNENAKWLFDINGKQIVEIHCEYEPWLLGKDLIKIKMNKEYKITKSNFIVLDENNKTLDFELKQKRNPTNKFAFRLKDKIKSGNKVKILFDLENNKHYEETIKVPNKNIIGILGKYNDL